LNKKYKKFSMILNISILKKVKIKGVVKNITWHFIVKLRLVISRLRVQVPPPAPVIPRV
jgi:hypothetical protein